MALFYLGEAEVLILGLPIKGTRRGWLWAAYGLVCVVWASAWVFTENRVAVSLWQQGLVFGLAGGICRSLSRRRVGGRRSERWKIGLGGFAVLGVPLLVRHLGFVRASDVDASAAWALVPVVVVLAAGWSVSEDLQTRLWPCVLGLMGILLVLPVQYPPTSSESGGWVVLCLALISVGVGSVWLFGLLRDVALVEAAWVLLSAQACVLLLAGWLEGERRQELLQIPSPLVWLYLLQFVVLIWLLREMEPGRLAGRFLLVPLVTVVEGMVVLRPEITVRLVVGVGLLVVGVVGLLRPVETTKSSGLNLRRDYP